MDTEKIFSRINGDYQLDAEIYSPEENGKFPGVLLNHGFLSAKEEYGNLAEKIAAKGYVVLTYDYRGHGKSEGERGYYTKSSHLQDTENALKTLLGQSKVNQERIAVIGHSLGSVATSRVVTESEIGKKCKTCVLLAPPRKLQDSLGTLELNAYKFVYQLATPLLLFTGKHIRLPYKFSAKDIYLSKEAIKQAESLGFLQNKMSVNNYQYLIEQVDHEQFASKISIPTLVMVAKGDKLVHNDSSLKVFQAVGSTDKKYLEINNSGHSLMADNSSAEVEQAITEWLAEKL